MWKHRLTALFLIFFGVFVGYFLFTSERGGFGSRFPFELGLDLKGGTHLLYKADVSKVSKSDKDSLMQSLRDTIERRVNIFGVSEPLVQVESGGIGSEGLEERLIVELPGVKDTEAAIKMIGQTPTLEFLLLKEGETPSKVAELAQAGKFEELQKMFIPTGLTGSLVRRADIEFNQTTNEPVVLLKFNAQGQALFADITKKNIGRYLAIFLDGEIKSIPVIRTEIPDGNAEISGGFTPEEAKRLARDLTYGALPVPVELVTSEVIGATLGREVVHNAIRAGLWGFVAVAFFLLFWYRLPGVVAIIALSLYSVLMLAMFKLIPVTLTAAGLAGFILSIGMAVDANILIFERTKEELREGKSIHDALVIGFRRAWPSIRDGHLTTLLAVGILYWLGGSAVIKGFALTFGIGVLLSLFTATTASRMMLLSISPNEKTEKKWQRLLFGCGVRSW
ncbi:MAG: protein translocase subunit SecD [Patescibacteria group bacterium]